MSQRNDDLRVYSIEFNSGLFGFIGSILMMLLNAISYIIGRLISYLILFAIGGALTVWGILALGNAAQVDAAQHEPVIEQQDKAQHKDAYDIEQYDNCE